MAFAECGTVPEVMRHLFHGLFELLALLALGLPKRKDLILVLRFGNLDGEDPAKKADRDAQDESQAQARSEED